MKFVEICRRVFFLAAMVLMLSCSGHDGEKVDKNKRKGGFIAQHVVLIGFDGWGSYCMDSVEMPHTRKLMAEGCYTLKKKAILPSISSPNWSVLFCGAPMEFVGWAANGTKPNIEQPYLNQRGKFPSIFTIMHEQMPSSQTICIHQWSGIPPLIDSDVVDICVRKGETEITPLACNYIRTMQPELLALVYDHPDYEGHNIGHDTPEYLAKMEVLDGYVGEIVEALKQAGIYENTIIILTSDHGGINKTHGGRTLEEMDTPFIIAGKNVRKGGEFGQPMVQYDVASTIAEIFGLKDPDCWRGKSMSHVFEK
jgi:hypothetical protein